ncbi:MAG: TonB-dependent receptor [Caulobacteraceae bacterium]|nr:TonB-dependent receptor [Caulobacteraceae bacterium]
MALSCLVLLASLAGPPAARAQDKAQAPEADTAHLLDLPIEQLMDIEVTSVGKKPQRLADAAAALYVITQDDIRRSGMTSVPELLRMVPGLDVAQANSHSWAISVRGSNDIYATKLLVLVDGRSVYTPLFSGVMWDTLDLPLQDIDRIEVIRGSGGTIWGANAVNGVINIVTKKADDTQGLQASVTTGTGSANSGWIRYGGKLSDNAYYRAYLEGSNQAAFVTPEGKNAGDSWRDLHGGVRLDWTPSSADAVSAQAEYFSERMESLIYLPSLVGPTTASALVEHNSGGHALVSWNHRFSTDSDLTLQAYFDRTVTDAYTGSVSINTYDLEVRHHIQLGSRNEVVWGGGYRWLNYTSRDTQYISLTPSTGKEAIFNTFVQDEFALTRTVHLIGGVKVEHNTFTGWDDEPSLRLVWEPTPNQTVWAAVSRSVRAPSITEEFLRFNIVGTPATATSPPTLLAIIGNPGKQESERATSFEVGYRTTLTPRAVLFVTAFYDREADLESLSPQPAFMELLPAPAHLVLPIREGNLLRGETYGAEAHANWQVTQRWKLFAAYSLLLGNLSTSDPTVNLTLQRNGVGLSPRHQVQIRSYLDLPARTEFDAALYYASALSAAPVPAYTRLDLRFGWRATNHLSFSLSGQNLLQPRHKEFLASYYGALTEVPRTAYLTATVGF